MSRLVRLLRARAAAVRRTDAGFTLVELLVTTVLLGVLGAVVVTTVVAATDSMQRSTLRQDNTRLAQTGMQNLTKAVRYGSLIEQPGGATALPALTEATPTSIEVHAFVGSRPVRLRYSVDAQGRLVERRTVADASSTAPYWTFTGAAVQRVVIGRVVNTATQPLFVHRDGTGAPFPLTALDDTQRRGVRSVDISLHVQADDQSRVRPAQVVQRVQLPNVGSIG